MVKKRVSKAPEERRVELIAAARRLFDKDGMGKTRVSDIVKAIGVAQGVFYYYFHSKDEIVEAVVDQVTEELRGQMQVVLQDADADFCKKLYGLTELYLGVFDQFTGDDALTLHDFLNKDNVQIQRMRELLIAHILSLVSEGKKQGHVKALYPEWTVRVLEAGLLHMAEEKPPDRKTLYALMEEALLLHKGELLQYA